MKYGKFLAVLRRNPDIGVFVNSHIGAPRISSACPKDEAAARLIEQERRTWIEDYLESIAFRPFKSLTLGEQSGRSETLGFSNHTSFFIHFHIDGNDVPHERMTWADDCTVREAIASRLEWHTHYWGPKGHAIKFGFVLKRTNTWMPKPQEAFLRESIELFRFPKDFTLTPAP